MRALLRSIPLLLVACGRSSPPATDDGAASASYDRYRRPETLIAALNVHPGDAVADVGAGTGYLSFRLADAVSPGGRVVATDIDDKALRAIVARHDPRVTVRRTPADDAQLEHAAYDLILLGEVDHLLIDRAAYFDRLIPALKPGGRIAISNRLPYLAPVADAAVRAHLSLVRDFRDLPAQFLLIYEARR